MPEVVQIINDECSHAGHFLNQSLLQIPIGINTAFCTVWGVIRLAVHNDFDRLGTVLIAVVCGFS